MIHPAISNIYLYLTEKTNNKTFSALRRQGLRLQFNSDYSNNSSPSLADMGHTTQM